MGHKQNVAAKDKCQLTLQSFMSKWKVCAGDF